MPDVLNARLDALALKLGPLTVAFDALGDAVSAAVSRFNSAASKLASIISEKLDVQTPPAPLTPGGGTSPTAAPGNPPNSPWAASPGGATAPQPSPAAVPGIGAAFVQALAPVVSLLQKIHAAILASTTTSPVNPPNSPWATAQSSPASANPSTQSLGAILTQAVAPVVAQLQRIHAAIASSTGRSPAQTTPAAGAALGSQTAATQAITAKVSQTQAQGESVAKAAISSPVSVFDSLLGKMMGPLTGIVDTFASVASKVTTFVGALNPSAVLQFGAAMRDLQATIGVALQPVLQGLTQIVRNTANALLPVMQRLAPVMKSLMTTVGEVAKVWVNTFAGLLSTLIPVIKFVADVFNALAPILQGAYAMFSGFVSALSGVVSGILSIFGINLTDVTSGLRKAMESLAKYTLLAVASLAKWINAGLGKNFIDGVKTALVGSPDKKDTTGLAAPQNAAISTFQDFGRSVTKAALIAGPGGGEEKKTDDWLKDIASNLDKIEAGVSSDLDAAVARIEEAIALAMRTAIREFGNAVYNRTANLASEAGHVLTGGLFRS